MNNMTALVSCFARAYHYKNCERHAFADPVAEQMLTAEEYNAISQNMTQGIQFFMPGFQGTQEEALQFIVDHQLAPSVLSRSAFCEQAIDRAVRLQDCRQVVIYACGYDTFSLRTNNQVLTVYEMDRLEMIADARVLTALSVNNGVPQYLLLPRKSPYESLRERFPMYAQIEKLASDENNQTILGPRP